jgi:DHA1 family bicyclomycin/chloramphenicol resistance-like MFS transporter
MQIQPASFAFTLLLGLLASVPFSSIDINQPALAATTAALGASPSDVGLTMSVLMLSVAAAPLIHGPASDRYGREPVIVLGVSLFVVDSVTCALAQSLPMLLPCRLGQSIGAASTATAFPIIRGLFDGNTVRAKLANAMNATMQTLPKMAGAVSAASGNIQMTGTISSDLVAVFHDGRSALSVAGVMPVCSLFALVFLLVACRRTAPAFQGNGIASGKPNMERWT